MQFIHNAFKTILQQHILAGLYINTGSIIKYYNLGIVKPSNFGKFDIKPDFMH